MIVIILPQKSLFVKFCQSLKDPGHAEVFSKKGGGEILFEVKGCRHPKIEMQLIVIVCILRGNQCFVIDHNFL